MIPHLHIVTFATRKTVAFGQLLHTARLQKIELTVLGEGQPFQGFGQKLLLIEEYMQGLDDQDILLYIDAYDTLLTAAQETILKQFLACKSLIVVAADRYCFPDEELASLHPLSFTPYRYVNMGNFIGRISALKEFLKEISPIDPAADDQRLMMRYCLNHPEKVTIDNRCELFLNTYEVRASDIRINYEKRTVTLLETGTTPPVIHGCRKSIWYQFLYDTLFKEPIHSPHPDEKSVFLPILAHNNALFLPRYLQSIDALDYNKKKITLYIRAFNNSDETVAILENWKKDREHLYHEIIFEARDIENAPVIENAPQRFKIPGHVRNESLKMMQERGLDYYFGVDIDTFIVPCTLKELIKKKKPIIAPLLKNFPPSKDLSSNFFADCTEDGRFKEHSDYFAILEKRKLGTFAVLLVLGVYLIQKECVARLSFTDETYDPEYIVFARTAREAHLEQFICNELDFGSIIHLTDYPSTEEWALLQVLLSDTSTTASRGIAPL